MVDVIEAFKAAGEPTRFRALRLIALAEGELCACEIVDALGKPQYTISKALGALVEAGLIEERREGRKTLYRLVRGQLNDALAAIVRSVPSGGELAADSARLAVRLAGNDAAQDGCGQSACAAL